VGSHPAITWRPKELCWLMFSWPPESRQAAPATLWLSNLLLPVKPPPLCHQRASCHCNSAGGQAAPATPPEAKRTKWGRGRLWHVVAKHTMIMCIKNRLLDVVTYMGILEPSLATMTTLLLYTNSGFWQSLTPVSLGTQLFILQCR